MLGIWPELRQIRENLAVRTFGAIWYAWYIWPSTCMQFGYASPLNMPTYQPHGA